MCSIRKLSATSCAGDCACQTRQLVVQGDVRKVMCCVHVVGGTHRFSQAKSANMWYPNTCASYGWQHPCAQISLLVSADNKLVAEERADQAGKQLGQLVLDMCFEILHCPGGAASKVYSRVSMLFVCLVC